jgi:hypothetical protein
MNDELRSAVAEAMADKSESQAEMGGARLPAVAVSSAVLSTAVLTKVEAAAAKGDAAKAGQITSNR